MSDLFHARVPSAEVRLNRRCSDLAWRRGGHRPLPGVERPLARTAAPTLKVRDMGVVEVMPLWEVRMRPD
jgi:hypothetical protein